MAQGDGLGQVFVQLQTGGNGSGYLGNLQDMGEPGPIMIPGWRKKDLGLMLQATKGFRVKNTIPISLKYSPKITAIRFMTKATSRLCTQAGIGREYHFFLLFLLTTNIHGRSRLKDDFFEKTCRSCSSTFL